MVNTPSIDPAEIRYQRQALKEVSRTFALTIPLLPEALEHAVGNAYLLCRIADTIEDDTRLSGEEKQSFSSALISLVEGEGDSRQFAAGLDARLSAQTPHTEKDLIAHTPQVIAITQKLSPGQTSAIQTCVRRMATGMPEFQRNHTGTGLADMATLNRYCYVVAGVVGEMLTDFFCAHSASIAEQRGQLSKLAFSFGQGLQLTNILKDIQVDKGRGICWLPADIFNRHGFDLTLLQQSTCSPGLTGGVNQLIAITRHHLDNALEYALSIPGSEIEIRRFLMFPLLLALLTLRKIHAATGNTDDGSIKISRKSVLLSGAFIKYGARQDRVVNHLFRFLSRGLPG